MIIQVYIAELLLTDSQQQEVKQIYELGKQILWDFDANDENVQRQAQDRLRELGLDVETRGQLESRWT